MITEIDENLVRADLTPSERAAHHAERKRLYLRLYPETGKGGDRKSAKAKSKRQNVAKTYTKAAARATGKTSRTVERDISRGDKIDPQALADLDRTCLDNGTELDALAKLPAAEQRRLAEAAKRGEKVSAISALSACGPEAPKTNDGTGKEPDRAPTLDHEHGQWRLRRSARPLSKRSDAARSKMPSMRSSWLTH